MLFGEGDAIYECRLVKRSAHHNTTQIWYNNNNPFEPSDFH